MKIDFTDAELETIAAAMDDYIAYDDPDASQRIWSERYP